ncbi:MAG: ABC transporter ATP-binding protein [Hyphomonadaceae bacterium]|nr:ABC transporter ATP-binding protein [Hyphomonadaceae bacterium]
MLDRRANLSELDGIGGSNTAEIILEAHGLRKEFSGFAAVAGVDLAVRHGSIHALIGPNGAGKTTVFNLLTKFIAPTAGRISFEGEDITSEPPAALARRGIVRSFQISAIFPHLSVHENLRIALQQRMVSPLWFWTGGQAVAGLQPRIAEVLEQFDLADLADHRAGELAYGQKRILELATTVATAPKLMLLDEPTQGLGHEDVDRVTALIKRVAVGRTVLMVEHNMRMVANVADRISVLRRGEKIAEGTYDEVSRDPQVIEAYLGSRARRRSKA